jgi:hypothetical protein
LEALAAEDGTALCRTERNGCLLSASRARGLGLDFGVTIALALRRSRPEYGYPLVLANLATLRFVLELLIMKEKLFPGSENEVISTVNTLEHLVLKIH